MQSNERQPICMAILGTTGTGKSTLAKHLLGKIGEERIVIVTYNDDPEIWHPYDEVESIDKPIKHSGIRKVTVAKYGKGVFQKLYKNLRNCTLVLDDCRQYIKANIEHTPGLVDLIVSHRHIGLDIIFVVHSPLLIPPQARPFIKVAYIGKCTVLIKTSNFEVSDPEAFLEAQKRVNQKTKEMKRHYGVFYKVKL